MKILAIESSAGPASVAIGEDNKLIAHYYANCGFTHSKTLMPMIESMLKNTGITTDKLDFIAVASGPGSFTGVRIGVAAAKGLAWAADKPCCAVSSLRAMSMNLAARDGLICAVMDARRNQVYNALFSSEQGKISRLCPDRAISLSELASDIMNYTETAVMLVGDGAYMCYDYLREAGANVLLLPGNSVYQNAAGVFYAACEKINDGIITDASKLVPFYLRASQAERNLLKEGTHNG